ncbi:MAG: shikimate kinase [Alistipes sp.]
MKSIFLVGYMGCGKSTLGRKLARRLNIPFFDTDSLIEEREGASVNDIFHYEGEAYFRELERETIVQILAEEQAHVVSTGGGLPVWQNNMELMNGVGRTIYLQRSVAQIIRRLSPYGRQKRPNLRGLSDEELVEHMTRNLAEREPFYAKAQTVVACEALSDDELITILLQEVTSEK